MAQEEIDQDEENLDDDEALDDEEIKQREDMYGHLIHVSDNDGGGGFGVSLTWRCQLGGTSTPEFTFFHESDGFQQALFSVGFNCECLKGRDVRPRVENIFDRRLVEVLGMVNDVSPV